MPRSTREAIALRRVNLADWITAIMSIFWSVWWGFFMNYVLASKKDIITCYLLYVEPKLWFSIPKNHYLILNVLIAAFFAFAYVHWLWEAQRTAFRNFFLRSFLRNSIPLGFALLLLLTSISFIGYAYVIPLSLLYYGVALTIIWPTIVLITLWKA